MADPELTPDAEPSEVPAFSRSGISSFTKCTAVLKTSLPDGVELDFRKKASEAGCTPAELLRDLVCLSLYDKTFGEIIAGTRREILGAPGRE